MQNYSKPYYMLLHAVTDALRAMEKQNFGQARDILIKGQAGCESWLLSEPEAGDEYEAFRR